MIPSRMKQVKDFQKDLINGFVQSLKELLFQQENFSNLSLVDVGSLGARYPGPINQKQRSLLDDVYYLKDLSTDVHKL